MAWSDGVLCWADTRMRDGRSKGQAALEYMVMISIALLIAAPIILQAQTSMQDVESLSKSSRIDSTLDSIEQGARLVNSQGSPARTTFAVTLPDRIVEARAEDNYVLYVRRGPNGNQTFVRFFSFNVTGNPPASDGLHRVQVEAVSPEGEPDYVNITSQ